MYDRPITWRKLGLVVTLRPKLWWWRTHCMVPTVEPLEGPYHKIYFSGRDDHNRSHIGWAIVDIERGGKVVEYSQEPVLTLGELGCFDDNGVTPSCVVQDQGRTLLYYIGWNQGVTVRMILFGGLAISEDGGNSFHRYSRAPILSRTNRDPFLNTAPFVVKDGPKWRMYYVGGEGWVNRDLARYNIRYAASDDGLTWRRDGRVCINFADSDENALARPMVLKYGAVFRMWFAHKGEAYRIGYAESEDGLNWRRRDGLAGIDVSESGFDSDMIEYAAVVEHAGRSYMFYNGNNYGYDGIGLAVES